jgi:hypothetical protein
MGELAVTMEGRLVAVILHLVSLKADTPVSVLAVHVLSILRERRVETCDMRVARVIGIAAAPGEAVIGAAVTGIRRMDIPRSAITAWVMAIRTTDIIRGDITLTATDTGRT